MYLIRFNIFWKGKFKFNSEIIFFDKSIKRIWISLLEIEFWFKFIISINEFCIILYKRFFFELIKISSSLKSLIKKFEKKYLERVLVISIQHLFISIWLIWK